MALRAAEIPKPDGRPADMTKPVQVFILLGQSNMVGLGKVKGGEISLEHAVKEKKKYQYLVDDAGAWTERKDVRYVQYMSGKGPLRNEWMTVAGGNLGPEYGIGHPLGNAIDAPAMILKCCIGNRALGWDLLPPGSEGFEFTDSKGVTWVHPGYKGSPERWKKGEEPKPIAWYAGKQYDDDTGDAKKALADLGKHYPDAKAYEVAGFFFWQGERDAGSEALSSRYEQNLVHFIKQLRKDFSAPNAKFVLGTLGEATKGSSGNGGKVLEAHLAVDGTTGKYPEFKGNVATIYTNPMAQGGSGNGHYGGKAEVYMDVGEAMGQAMVELLKTPPAKTGRLADPDDGRRQAASEEEDVAFFEKKYQKKITGVKPKGEYSDPDQFYSAIGQQLGITEIAWKAAAEKFGWEKVDGKRTFTMLKGGPTAGVGQGTWDVMFIRSKINPETKRPDPAAAEQVMVQLDYDGNFKIFVRADKIDKNTEAWEIKASGNVRTVAPVVQPAAPATTPGKAATK
jgi:hypothetical protein